MVHMSHVVYDVTAHHAHDWLVLDPLGSVSVSQRVQGVGHHVRGRRDARDLEKHVAHKNNLITQCLMGLDSYL